MSMKSHSFSVTTAENNIVVVMNRRTATLVKEALEVVSPDRQCDEEVARNLALHIEVQISRGVAKKSKAAPRTLPVSQASTPAEPSDVAQVPGTLTAETETGVGAIQ